MNPITRISAAFASTLALALALAVSARAQIAQPDGGTVSPGTLPVRWDTGGPRCMEMQEWQAHEYNPDFVILRQSGCTDYEKPFVFLMFGKQRGLLLDTGSRKGNIAPEIRMMVHRWLTRNHRDSLPLVVVHTHSHGDHTAGDGELQAMNDPAIPLTLIPATVEANSKFYGIAKWPDDPGSVDLGDRVIDVLPIPGHDVAGVALYDRQTGILFTGDNVYPGRLYISDLPAFDKSNQRLIHFTEGRMVTHILGNHIEQQRTPYLDYPVGTMYQPNEHALDLPRSVLLEIQAGIDSMKGKPRRIAYRDVTLWPSADPSVRAEMNATHDATQKYQLEHMWDQTQK